MADRYAIYFVPQAGSLLENVGHRWFGRDEYARPVDALFPDGLDAAEVGELVARPRLYGFHATLKAPFRLAEGRTAAGLDAALRQFAAAQTAVTAPPLVLKSLSNFLALVPAAPCAALNRLADGCVGAFDGFRAPMTGEETTRRLAAGLSARQQRLLERWGYPYVSTEFHFHLTLTGPITDSEVRLRTQAALAPVVAPLAAEPLSVAEISLFRQAGADAPFVLVARYPFGPGPA